MDNLSLQGKINIISQAIKNVCNQATLPIEIVALIVDNISLELHMALQAKEVHEQISQLQSQINTSQSDVQGGDNI